MPLPGIGAARSLLDALQRDLLETEDQDFDRFFDRWSARGLPEIEEYRGERRRSRGELLSEIGRTDRAIALHPELLQVEQAGETPLIAGARRVARGAERLEGVATGINPWDTAWGAALDAAPTPAQYTALSDTPDLVGDVELVPVMSRRSRFGETKRGEIVAPPDYFFSGGQMAEIGAALGAALVARELVDQRRRRIQGGGEIPDSRPEWWQLRHPELSPPRQEFDIPPPIPEMTEPETFPVGERTPQVEVFPADPGGSDIEIFPIPDMPQVQAEVFLGLSDAVIRELARPLEAHRGDKFTRRGNDIVVQKTYEVLSRWFPDIEVKVRFDHIAGATQDGDGMTKLKERFVWDELKGSYSIPDITILDTKTGRRIALITGMTLKDGRTLIAAERGQLERLGDKLRDKELAGGLPKLRPGMDETAYAEEVERQLIDLFKGYFGQPPVR